MDLLIFIGSVSAFFYSLYGAVSGNPQLLFFETSAMIITLVLAGNYIEHRTVRKTQSAIEALKNLQVDSTQRFDPKTGQTETIPVSKLKTDDLVLINTGDTFPADGIIISGEAWVDESMISGETEAILKTRQDEVIGATLVSSGSIKVQITRTGSDTILQRMIELVKRAQREKPPVQRLADKISGIFVPVVITIALLTFIITWFFTDAGLTRSILNSIAVLVISCPCAMGLATPTAIAAGVGRMSRQGILIKSGKTLEHFARIRRMIFDKTGTLTTGQFRVEKLDSLTIEADLAKNLIFSLESHSSHPIAKSIRQWIRNADATPEKIEWQHVNEIKGKGVEGVLPNGDRYFFGTIKDDQSDDKRLGLFQNDALCAVITLRDDLRQNARESLAALKNAGVKMTLLSGDQPERVRELAIALDIPDFHAQQSPEEKNDFIHHSNQEEITAMVGDGINDAAALSRASVGISMSQASDIAINAADVVLMHQDLGLIPKALNISRATLTTIKQNLFWAFSYNLIAIPLAAMGYLNPMWGALFMTFSDIMVVGNSIRLIYRRID